jgi:hypothetical protein
MKIVLLSHILAAALLFSFHSCKSEEDTYLSLPLQADYLPLFPGKYAEYVVDSLIFDPKAPIPSYARTVLVRELVTDTFRLTDGQLAYRIERSERPADTLPWQVTQVLSAALEENRIVIREDNLAFIRLVLPPRQGLQWDGNAFLDPATVVSVAGENLEMFKNWSYRIAEDPVAWEIDSLLRFDSVVTVSEADDENLIELRRSTARYAKGVGLVYREAWILDTQCVTDCMGMTWEEKAEKGYILRQRITNHN